MNILALTSADKPDELLGTIALIGDRLVASPGARGLLSSFRRHLTDAKTDQDVFDTLKSGWSNGYVVLTHVSTPKE